MGKEIYYGDDAKRLLKNGVDTLYEAVKITLGPMGRNVILNRQYGSPLVTKDGVTVAKDIELDNNIENMGAQLVKEVASKTADIAGDGTTTATVLAHAMITNGMKNVTAGANPMDLKKGMEKALRVVVDILNDMSQEIGDDIEKIKQVATISANNDSDIGELIAQAMSKVKKDGIITIEEARGIETSIKIVDGMQFDRGYISPYFVTDTEKMEVVYENPYILITDKKLSVMKDIIGVLEQCVQSRPLIIISEDVEGEVMATLVLNRIRANLRVAAVKAPGFGDRRKQMLEDIAILTGGNVISDDRGLTLDSTELRDLGMAEKVIITKDTTTIVNGNGEKINIENRIKQIKNEIDNSTSEYDKEKLQERLAKLTGGVAVIYVGAASEVELKEKKDRFDDALHATKAAIDEGIIPGGGVGYIRSIEALDYLKGNNEDETIGISIVKKSLEEPLKQIVQNSGREGSVVVNKVKKLKGYEGYNARKDEYEDLVLNGVIDPTKVVRVALENAVSVSSMFITTECVVCDIKDKDTCGCNTKNQPQLM